MEPLDQNYQSVPSSVLVTLAGLGILSAGVVSKSTNCRIQDARRTYVQIKLPHSQFILLCY